MPRTGKKAALQKKISEDGRLQETSRTENELADLGDPDRLAELKRLQRIGAYDSIEQLRQLEEMADDGDDEEDEYDGGRAPRSQRSMAPSEEGDILSGETDSDYGESKAEADSEEEILWLDDDSRFADMTDEEIIIASQENNDSQAQDYIINKYRNFVRVKARSYFLIGADREDIIQEGMIGLFKAIRDYRRERLSSFHAFAELCVTRQIITAIKTATRQKHIPLNSYISINKPIYDEDSDRTLLDVLPGGKVSDPEEMVISQEEYSAIALKMETILSELEWQVLIAYLDGRSYQEIAENLNRHVKSIDNALQRVKRKLEKYMGSYIQDVDFTTIYHGITTINRQLHDVDIHRERPADGVRHHKIRKKRK